jgi:flagellar protein FliO/FliZ
MFFFVPAHIMGAGTEHQPSVLDCTKNNVDCSNLTDSSLHNDARSQTDIAMWDYIKMIFALLFVLGLLYGLLKFIQHQSRSYQPIKTIQHIGGTPLGGNRSLQVVKVGDSLFVLGVGEDVTLLKEIDDEDEKEKLLTQFSQEREELFQPIKWLDRFQKQSNTQQPFAETLKQQLDEIKEQRQKIVQSKKEKGKQEHE